jgi:ABC-type transport system involved in multi-copper enzyme maturation permease subunit
MTLTKSHDFEFKVYTRPTGLGTGTYDHWLLRGASIEIERSLFEGDLLTITSTRKNQDVQIDKVRPVRFYWKGTKLFDGCIRAPKYDNRQNKYRDLVTRGVLKLLFSRPVGKNEFLIGKLLGISFVLAIVMLLAAAISAVSSAVLVSLTAGDMIHLFSFYGFSLVYLLGFAFIGFSSALVKEDEVIALLIPIIFWITITFVLPQLTSALYPTGSLNPTLPQTDILNSPALQTLQDAVYPFSISQHYKEAASTILDIKATGTDAPVQSGIINVAVIFFWMLLGLAASFAAVYSFDKSR